MYEVYCIQCLFHVKHLCEIEYLPDNTLYYEMLRGNISVPKGK